MVLPLTPPAFLVTHSGGFHADEVLSSVVLARLFPGAKRLRTRDPEWTTPAADRIIYDVGRAYDPARTIFDHHQPDAPLRADGQPFSSFGLIWQHYGRAYLRALAVPEAHVEGVHASFDARMVLPVDLMDNGAINPAAAGVLADVTLPVLIETLKPSFDDTAPQAEDRAFEAALSLAAVCVEAVVRQLAARFRAEGVVHAAIARAGASRVLELPMGMPSHAAITAAGADHLLFVIHPRESDWALNGIRKDEGSFALRADLPAAWAGLTDAAFEAASGVPGARFCHNGRFIAIAATRQAIVRLAEIAVDAADQPR